jgi:hypothetical protein
MKKKAISNKQRRKDKKKKQKERQHYRKILVEVNKIIEETDDTIGKD